MYTIYLDMNLRGFYVYLFTILQTGYLHVNKDGSFFLSDDLTRYNFQSYNTLQVVLRHFSPLTFVKPTNYQANKQRPKILHRRGKQQFFFAFSMDLVACNARLISFCAIK